MIKSQILISKSQLNPKSQFPIAKFTRLVIGHWICIGYWILAIGISPLFAQEAKEPIIVNGDVVEYSTDNKEVSATGNVSVTYKGTKLTCKKLTVNMETKVGVATGDARVEDKNSVIEGEKLTYNFQTKAGTIINANFRSNPYFGKGETAKKVSDAEFIIQRGHMTTCNYDNPHYRISSKKIDFFPNDKVLTKNNTVYIGKVPLAHTPQYNHSLKDPLVHVQLMPGKSKDWGAFLLTAWRYTFNDNLKGRIYADYREKRGAAEGFGLNYTSQGFGKGDYKYYYTQERPRNFEEGEPAEFQRYFIRWRHKWDIDEQTNLISEYYKITDSKRALLGSTYSFLKDYFFREYEKDVQPVSYLLLHKNFTYSNMDFFIQKRTNRWYDPGYLEKIPEIKYNLSSLQIAETPLYFTNTSSAGNFNKKNTSTSTPTANDTNPDVHVNRLDTSNKLSLPMRVAFINLSPFVMNRETFYDKYAVGSSTPPRTVFYGGADASTKFYRIFNVKSNFLGMEINSLRHIITPSIGYAYNHEPTVLNSKIRQIDDVDSITRSNSMSLQLYNKLQTKRKSQSVDFIDFRTTSTYTFKPKSGNKLGSNLSDILFELKLLPYSWMRVDADATYMRSGNRSDFRYGHFSNANYDLNFDFGGERSFAFGQRYQLKGGNEITYDIDWRLSPKWKFYFYQRYNRGHDPTLKRGLREQEYGISRDLHCWTVEFNYNVKRGVGEAVWFIFRLKAFPELEFEYNQNYHAPKAGSQSNP